MPAAVKAPKRKTTHTEPEEDSFAEGIIKGLQDFKEGRITRFKDAEELADICATCRSLWLTGQSPHRCPVE